MSSPLTIRTTSNGELEFINLPSNCEVIYDSASTTITCGAVDYSFETLDLYTVAVALLITLIVFIGVADIVRRIEEWVEMGDEV